MPGLVRKVAERGHEIGCHNYMHFRIPEVFNREFGAKLSKAKSKLEDVSGQKVFGFRAPDFSITKKNLWVIDVLKELGFVYDSSIYPIGLHDVYGMKNANRHIHKLSNDLIEFPMSSIEYFSKRFPFGGGGYFRLYPLWLTNYFIRALNRDNIPCMTYIHPYEVGPVIPKIPGLSPHRKFRHYYNCKNGKKRLGKLCRSFKFSTIMNVLNNSGRKQISNHCHFQQTKGRKQP